MFMVVTSRDDVLDMVAVAVDGFGPVRHSHDEDLVWTEIDRNPNDWVGVIIDFRDRVQPRTQLLDQLVRRGGMPGLLALVDPAQGDLIFEVARRGAHHWAPAPPEYRRFRTALEQVLSTAVVEVPSEQKRFFERAMLPISGRSRAAQRLRHQVWIAAASDVPVVLTGESGVGKQVVARVIHDLSDRRSRAFVDVNICGIAEALFETELFGSVPGAFTGATRRPGFFRAADRGTLFLDEIGDLPHALQPKILKAVENGLVYPVGSHDPKQVDFRLLCASNRNLQSLIRVGSFRTDLWHRIASIVIEVPPLRERLEDISFLAHRILADEGYEGVSLKPDAVCALQHHPWSGNIRELKSVLKRSLVVSSKQTLHARDLSFDPRVGRELLN